MRNWIWIDLGSRSKGKRTMFGWGPRGVRALPYPGKSSSCVTDCESSLDHHLGGRGAAADDAGPLGRERLGTETLPRLPPPPRWDVPGLLLLLLKMSLAHGVRDLLPLSSSRLPPGSASKLLLLGTVARRRPVDHLPTTDLRASSSEPVATIMNGMSSGSWSW